MVARSLRSGDGIAHDKEDSGNEMDQLSESPNRISDTRFPTAIPQQALRQREVQEQAPSETTNGFRDRTLREEYRLPSSMRLAAAVARPFESTANATDGSGTTPTMEAANVTTTTTSSSQHINAE